MAELDEHGNPIPETVAPALTATALHEIVDGGGTRIAARLRMSQARHSCSIWFGVVTDGSRSLPTGCASIPRLRSRFGCAICRGRRQGHPTGKGNAGDRCGYRAGKR